MFIKDLSKLNKEDLKGKVICFPTDTVYGVGCLIDDEIATQKIYQIKKRDFGKPLANLVPDSSSIKEYVDVIPPIAKQWIEKYWPGALTIVFKKNQDKVVPSVKGFDTIGFRMPNSKIALAVLNQFGPLATTSVNISNEAPLNDLEEIRAIFKDEIDYYIEDLEVISKVSSTVVDVSKGNAKILRQGDIELTD